MRPDLLAFAPREHLLRQCRMSRAFPHMDFTFLCPERRMSIRLMSDVWQMNMPSAEKLVFLALADAANDEGLCWPSIATVARKSGLSERSVQRAIRKFEGSGWLERHEVIGKGCKYLLNPRHSVTPVKVAPVTNETKTPDTVSPKPLRTIIPQKATPSSGKRATRMPHDFSPTMSGKTKAIVDGWPPGRLADELDHFASHHTAKGTTSYCWQASWRTWVSNSKKWEPRNGHRKQQFGPGEYRDPILGDAFEELNSRMGTA